MFIYNDQQMLYFMANDDVFKDVAIDEDKHDPSLQTIANDKKCNLIPKGVVSLKMFYDLQNYFQGPRNRKTHSSTLTHEHINLGTEQDLKFANLSTCCTLQEWQAFVHLFK